MEAKAIYNTRVVIHDADDREELDQLVLSILQRHVGKEHRISRFDLLREVYGPWQAGKMDSNSVEDRRVRESIERLREKYVILSSSGSGGYWLPESESEAQDFIAEMESRAMKMLQMTGRMKRNLREQFQPGGQMGLGW
jgi:hypothetical protein